MLSSATAKHGTDETPTSSIVSLLSTLTISFSYESYADVTTTWEGSKRKAESVGRHTAVRT